jgi:hypothetical protein
MHFVLYKRRRKINILILLILILIQPMYLNPPPPAAFATVFYLYDNFSFSYAPCQLYACNYTPPVGTDAKVAGGVKVHLQTVP